MNAQRRRKLYVQIRVTREEDSVHVPHFPLVPVGTGEEADNRGDGRDFIGVCLDADPGLVRHGKKIVDDLYVSLGWQLSDDF